MDDFGRCFEDGEDHLDICVFDRGSNWISGCGYADDLALKGKSKCDCAYWRSDKPEKTEGKNQNEKS